jgi:hypothetical protein
MLPRRRRLVPSFPGCPDYGEGQPILQELTVLAWVFMQALYFSWAPSPEPM